MKILICGDCPDPLTTVAQELNRMYSHQFRPTVHPGQKATSPPAEILPQESAAQVRDTSRNQISLTRAITPHEKLQPSFES
jgi:hypothetical protein